MSLPPCSIMFPQPQPRKDGKLLGHHGAEHQWGRTAANTKWDTQEQAFGKRNCQPTHPDGYVEAPQEVISVVLSGPRCPICAGRLDNLFEIPGGSRMVSHLWPLRSPHLLAPLSCPSWEWEGRGGLAATSLLLPATLGLGEGGIGSEVKEGAAHGGPGV